MIIEGTRVNELKGQASKLLADAQAIFSKDGVTAEERANAQKMLGDAVLIKADLDGLVAIKEASKGLADVVAQENKGGDPRKSPAAFKSLGDFLRATWLADNKGQRHPALKAWQDATEPQTGGFTGQNGWIEGKETKDLIESIGASGGYLVPTEQSTNLMQWDDVGENIVRSKATIIPMSRRAITIPVLNQTTTTAGQPHWWGGVLAYWTEEAQSKTESQPSFRQIQLVCHKLVCYTEASDELLEDSAVSLEALLRASFSGTIAWEEQDAFINGSGAGQPLGVINAGATITVLPQAVNALAVLDFVNMLENFQGRNPVWFMNRRWMSNLLTLTGPPGGNAQYVFIPNAREGAPATLFGYPVYFVEQMPAPGQVGSVLLADWSKYLIGDRQSVTIDSTKAFRFQNDLTAWRAVHRVDGQPWLSAPLTYSDSVTQVSPFVILGGVAAT